MIVLFSSKSKSRVGGLSAVVEDVLVELVGRARESQSAEVTGVTVSAWARAARGAARPRALPTYR